MPNVSQHGCLFSGHRSLHNTMHADATRAYTRSSRVNLARYRLLVCPNTPPSTRVRAPHDRRTHDTTNQTHDSHGRGVRNCTCDALGTARDASHGRGADTARCQSTMSQSVKEHRLSLSRRRLKKGAQLNAGFAGRGAVSTVTKRQDGSIC